ncbi:MAG: leucyl/phenylalanyl-tRNA--protein transferase [Bacteroidales bacterium]|nr:leucyl/phenylalanyl-tRNA--protein transferase [Bacteroidales bacterium]
MFFLLPFDPPSFPEIENANEDGLLAVGGLLNPTWIIEAYSKGIFPWFNEEQHILWWSPNPRAVMSPSEVKISKSMNVYFNQNIFELKIDADFEQVISNCQKIKRKKQDGTWITDNMLKNYIKLHKKGYAHSFETWQNKKLVGGLYGISLNNAFFGESMFSYQTNASKFAFISMCKILEKNNFLFIDCQMPNNHLSSLGCKTIPRKKFAQLLLESKKYNSLIGNWSKLLQM